MNGAIARAEPIGYPAKSRGLNFFDLDVNLQRLLWRRAAEVLETHGARLGDFGAWAGGPLDEQAEYSDRYAPPRLETHGSPCAVRAGRMRTAARRSVTCASTPRRARATPGACSSSWPTCSPPRCSWRKRRTT